MPEFTHQALCELAVKWLRRAPGKIGPACQVAVSEAKSCWDGEIPDAIGFRTVYDDSGSVVVEVKVSWADFVADANKPHRQQPHLGMGAFRYFLAPAGLIPVDKLPPRWGLIEVNPKGVLSVIEGHVLARRADQHLWRHEHALSREWMLLASLLSRVGDVDRLHCELKRTRNEHSRLARQCDALAQKNRLLSLELSAARYGTDIVSTPRPKARPKSS